MAEGKTINMKLLINSKTNKVVFAEAGKECVDFFLHLLALPIGTVVKCLTTKAMVGSLGSLYDSLENLSADYLQPNATKDCLLNPKAALGTAEVPLLMINNVANSNVKTSYSCPYGCYSLECDGVDVTRQNCSDCGRLMTSKKKVITKTSTSQNNPNEGGYVKGVVTYMIMDDLAIKPMSTISSITLLNKFNVTDVGCLVEEMVSLDMTKGIAVLRASFVSKTVLTDVFLANKAK